MSATTEEDAMPLPFAPHRVVLVVDRGCAAAGAL
jgi:hypothetical protein